MTDKYQFYYKCPDDSIIRIAANRRPSYHTMPKSGIWILREYNDSQWRIPCFPEITWFKLKKLHYIGKVSNDR